jgi:hypothetical protein
VDAPSEIVNALTKFSAPIYDALMLRYMWSAKGKGASLSRPADVPPGATLVFNYGVSDDSSAATCAWVQDL